MAIRQKDYDAIVNDYINDVPLEEIVKQHSLSSCNYIYKILKIKNIPKKKGNWTIEHTKILYEYYPTTDWDVLLELLKPFPKDTILHQASKLQIKRLIHSDYSEDELNILHKNYKTMSTKELAILLPNRTESSIITKGYRLGLVNREKWSEEDSELLKKLYLVKTNKELGEIFNRTTGSIMGQGQNLGLNKNPEAHIYVDYDREKLTKDLREFANILGRTPIAIEVDANKGMAHSQTYGRCFGGYINACQSAGLEPNYDGNMFSSKTYRSKNNDLCLSQPELIITNLFIDNSLEYKKEAYYSAFTNDARCGFKRCDWFLLDGIIVEYFGMQRREGYKKRIKDKQEICLDNDLKLLELYPKDMKNGLKGLIDKFKEYGIELKIN